MKAKYVLVEVERLPSIGDAESLLRALRPLGDVKLVLGYEGGDVVYFDERFNEAWRRDFEECEDAEETVVGFARHIKAGWLLHFYDGDRGVFAIAGGVLRLAPLVKVGSDALADTYKYLGRLDLERLRGEVLCPCEELLKRELRELADETIRYVRTQLEEELRANGERLPHDTVDALNEAVSTLEAAERYIREKYSI